MRSPRWLRVKLLLQILKDLSDFVSFHFNFLLLCFIYTENIVFLCFFFSFFSLRIFCHFDGSTVFLQTKCIKKTERNYFSFSALFAFFQLFLFFFLFAFFVFFLSFSFAERI